MILGSALKSICGVFLQFLNYILDFVWTYTCWLLEVLAVQCAPVLATKQSAVNVCPLCPGIQFMVTEL